jgi:hypothetical protein
MSGIFGLSGVALSVVAGRYCIGRLEFIRRSAVVQGMVVGLREERDGMDARSVRYPRIRFQTVDGRDITFESDMARGGDTWRIGETLSVRYRLDHPETAELDSFAALWGATITFALLAFVFIAVGAGLWWGFIPG